MLNQGNSHELSANSLKKTIDVAAKNTKPFKGTKTNSTIKIDIEEYHQMKFEI